jgi:uncharacterized protein (DUF2062 family)
MTMATGAPAEAMKWQQWSYVRQLKLNYLRFSRLRGTPDEIAKGFALGIFIGMTPTFGFQVALAILFAYLLKENRLAAVLGVFITNPLTAPVIYAMEYEAGRILLGMERLQLPQEFSFSALGRLGLDVLMPLWLGGVVFGIFTGALSYALALRFVPLAKTWRLPRWRRPRKKRTGD